MIFEIRLFVMEFVVSLSTLSVLISVKMRYRETPNLQWFCDSCIIQSRSFDVSSPQFNNFNSTAFIPTSLFYCAQGTLIAAKSKPRNRNRRPIANAGSNDNSSVSLGTQSANAKRDAAKSDGLISSSPSARMFSEVV